MIHSGKFLQLKKKEAAWEPFILHIISAWHMYPGCHGDVVAKRSIYLQIWHLQMLLGTALNSKAMVK